MNDTLQPESVTDDDCLADKTIIIRNDDDPMARLRAMGIVRPENDPLRKAWIRCHELTEACAECFACSRKFDAGETVWMGSIYVGTTCTGKRRWRPAPFCEECFKKKGARSGDGYRCNQCRRYVIRQPRPRSARYFFCCDRCRWTHANARRKKRRGDQSRPCSTCGETFTPPRTDAKYCSPRCRQKAYRHRVTDK